MRFSSLLSITLLGVATYLFLELFFGSYGVLAYTVVNDYVQVAEERLDELKTRQAELELLAQRLSNDREMVRLEARDVGFIQGNEIIVRVEGHEPRPRHRYLPGTTPAASPHPRDNRPLFRTIALVVILAALLVEVLRSTTRAELPERKRTDRWNVEVDGESVR